MDCKRAAEAIVLDHYGELEPDEKARLEDHLEACPKCAAERKAMEKVFALVDACAPAETPLPDPERTWREIQKKIQAGSAFGRRPRAFGWRWAWAAPVFALVLLAGIFIGRTWFRPQGTPQPAAIQAAAAGLSLKPVMASYFENLRPILMDYANVSNGAPSGRTIVVEEKVIRDLLLENIVLKRRLAGKDPAAAELLDDLDLILKEISHRDAPDAASAGTIRDLIRQRDVLFKMNIIKTL